MVLAYLIQGSGRAGRDGTLAKVIIYYSGKDIKTDFQIIAENRET